MADSPRAECPSDGDHGQDDNACFCLTPAPKPDFVTLTQAQANGSECYNGSLGACLSIRCGSNCSSAFDRMHPCPACLIREREQRVAEVLDSIERRAAQQANQRRTIYSQVAVWSISIDELGAILRDYRFRPALEQED